MILSTINNVDLLTYLNPIVQLAPSNGFFFGIHGKLNDQLVEIYLGLTELSLEGKEVPKSIKKKFFFLLVESLQNVTRHSKNSVQNDFSIVQSAGTDFLIGTGNAILELDVSKVESMLAKINQSSHEELREMYFEILGDGSMSERGGAGLGLIEIARKSKSPISSSVQDHSTGKFLFLETQTDNSLQTDLLQTEQMYDLFKEGDISVLYKGDFSEENVAFLLQVLGAERSEKDISDVGKTKLFSVGVELLQNLSKHGHKSGKGATEGVFCVSDRNNHIQLMTSNHIKPEKAEKLEEMIVMLNSITPDQLEEKYNEILLSEDTETELSTGLGLIDIRLKSNALIQYDTRPGREDLVLFIISIDIEK